MDKFKAYIRDSYDELIHNVTWPTMAEVAETSILVLVASLIIAVFVFAFDYGIENVLKLVYSSLTGGF